MRAVTSGMPLSASIARAVVLVSGAAILVVETLATRLVAPYVGLTLESTTAVIGVALLGIALGAAWGGRLADTLPPRHLVTGALAVGGLLVLAVRPIVRLVGPWVGAGPIAAVLLVSASTLAPVLALAMVTPAATRARLSGLSGSGSVVGSLSAASTVGSIAGTFLTGFVLVTLLPMTLILGVTSGCCLLLALIAAPRRSRRAVGGTSAAVVLLGTALVGVPGQCDVDTAYYCARVIRDPDRASGRILMLDDLRHSYVDLADPRHLEFAYTQRFADVIDTWSPPGEPVDSVHLGGGGFTMPRWLAATRPGSRSLVLELDPTVVELGRAELGVSGIPGVTVRVGDARVSLAEQPDDSAELIIGDAFGSRSLPWHLATVEFIRDVGRVLTPDGIYLINIIDNDPHAFLEAEINTVAEVFDEVAMLMRPEQLGHGSGGNAVLVATNGAALDYDELAAHAAARGEPGSVHDPAATRRFAAEDPFVLTDNRAPVDQLLNPYAPA